MISIPEHTTKQVVFIAPAPGIHVFVSRVGTHQWDVGFVPPGGEDVGYYDISPRSNGVFGQHEFVVFLEMGWTIRHQGPACTLYGVRIGDEL